MALCVGVVDLEGGPVGGVVRGVRSPDARIWEAVFTFIFIYGARGPGRGEGVEASRLPCRGAVSFISSAGNERDLPCQKMYCRCISLERGSVGAHLGLPALRAGLALEAGLRDLEAFGSQTSEPQSTI